jgi:hypothetical protein
VQVLIALDYFDNPIKKNKNNMEKIKEWRHQTYLNKKLKLNAYN